MLTKLRAIVASENPEERHLLTQVVEKDRGVVVVGQADNALKAQSMARSLRPEVVVVDSYLPYNKGLDSVRLSRISGLDTAMNISQELPKSLVMLLPNSNITTYRERELAGHNESYFYTQTTTASIPVNLHELYYEKTPAVSLIFANVETKEQVSVRQRIIKASEKGVLFSSLSVLGGLGLLLSFILAGAGALLIATGISGVLLSLATWTIAKLWPKGRIASQECQIVETVKLKEAQFDNKANAERMSCL